MNIKKELSEEELERVVEDVFRKVPEYGGRRMRITLHENAYNKFLEAMIEELNKQLNGR